MDKLFRVDKLKEVFGNDYLESNAVWLCVSRSANSPRVLAKFPLFLVFTPANTDPSRGVFWVNRELVEMKLPCLQKKDVNCTGIPYSKLKNISI